MPFVIDDVVIFDEVKGSLTNINTQDEVNLPPTAAFILQLLFINGGSPVERSDFIEKVNKQFGFDLSNNTLNQYVSLIRKNIRNLGVEVDLIVTVPKVGFYISSEVNVKKEKTFYPINNELSSAHKKKKDLFAYSMIIMVFIIMLEVVYYSFFFVSEPEDYPLVKVGKIGMCDLFLPENLSKVNLADAMNTANILSNSYLPCTPGSVFIYDINALDYLNNTGKKHLSRCTGGRGEDFLSVCSEVSLSD